MQLVNNETYISCPAIKIHYSQFMEIAYNIIIKVGESIGNSENPKLVKVESNCITYFFRNPPSLFDIVFLDGETRIHPNSEEQKQSDLCKKIISNKKSILQAFPLVSLQP